MHSLYVDNVLIAGHDRANVELLRERAVKQFNRHGIKVHGIQDVDTSMVLLGGAHAGPSLESSLSAPRYGRLYRVISCIFDANLWLSSVQLSRLQGHLVFACLIRKALLSVFRNTYDFMSRGCVEPRRHWAGVKTELNLARGLLIMARRRLDAPWYTTLVACIACGSGHVSGASQWTVGRLVKWANGTNGGVTNNLTQLIGSIRVRKRCEGMTVTQRVFLSWRIVWLTQAG